MQPMGMNEIHMMAGALKPDAGRDDEAERGGQAVGRCGRGHPDHGGRDQAEGAGLEALALDLRPRTACPHQSPCVPPQDRPLASFRKYPGRMTYAQVILWPDA